MTILVHCLRESALAAEKSAVSHSFSLLSLLCLLFAVYNDVSMCFHLTRLELDVLLQSFFTIPSFWRDYVPGLFHFVHHCLNITGTFSFSLSLFVQAFSDLPTAPYSSLCSWHVELLMLIKQFIEMYLVIVQICLLFYNFSFLSF